MRHLDTLQILLVDNNPDGLIVRKALLEEFGFCVRTAASGEEGINLFNASAFDLVITVFRMSGMTGSELIRRIRQHTPNACVILLSSSFDRTDPADETRADVMIEKGAQEGEELVRSVQRLLRSHRPKAAVGRSRTARSS